MSVGLLSFGCTPNPAGEVELIGTQIGSTTGGFANLLIDINDYTAISWVKTALTPAVAATTAPDNTTTANSLTETAANSLHRMTQQLDKAASSLTYTATYYVKAGSRSRCVVVIEDTVAGSNGAYSVFDLSGAQIGVAATLFGSGFSSQSSAIAASVNGFYKCTLTVTTNTAATIVSVLGVDNGSGTGALSQSYAGSAANVAIYSWGAGLVPSTSNSNVLTNLKNGDTTSYWQDSDALAWAGVDMGSGKTATLTAVQFAPRPGQSINYVTPGFDREYEVINAQVQSSNDQTFASGISTLDTIPAFPFYPRFNLSERAASGTARAFRWKQPYGNLSQLKFIGQASSSLSSVKPMTPTISPWGGGFSTGSATVTLSSRTTSAFIYYTTDGTAPNNTKTLYTAPFTLTIGGAAKTVKAIAYEAIFDNPYSDVASAVFNPWQFKPNEDWYDDSGVLIEAHGGTVIASGSYYYWFGNQMNRYNASDSSQNLPRRDAGIWQYKILQADLEAGKRTWIRVGQIVTQPLDGSGVPWDVCIRPSVVFNSSTNKYVMWCHVATGDLATERAATWTATNIEGPWASQNSNLDPDGVGLKDPQLFVDDDGSGYVFYNPHAFTSLVVSKLSSDYLSTVSTATVITGVSPTRESQTVFRRGSTYFLITSASFPYATATTADNQYIVNTSASPMSNWGDYATTKQAVFASDPVNTAFQNQTARVIKIVGKSDAYMYIGDHWWNATDLYSSRQVWLPLTFSDSTHLQASVPASWDIPGTFPT